MRCGLLDNDFLGCGIPVADQIEPRRQGGSGGLRQSDGGERLVDHLPFKVVDGKGCSRARLYHNAVAESVDLSIGLLHLLCGEGGSVVKRGKQNEGSR